MTEDERQELHDLRALFALQQTRMREATARWRAEDPEARALVWPDLGALLEWLMNDADRARTQVGQVEALTKDTDGGEDELSQLRRDLEVHERRYLAVQKVLDGSLGVEVTHGTGEGLVAGVALLAQRYADLKARTISGGWPLVVEEVEAADLRSTDDRPKASGAQPRLSSDDTACVAYDHDPDTGLCSCGHDEEQHEGQLGGCRRCEYIHLTTDPMPSRQDIAASAPNPPAVGDA